MTVLKSFSLFQEKGSGRSSKFPGEAGTVCTDCTDMWTGCLGIALSVTRIKLGHLTLSNTGTES